MAFSADEVRARLTAQRERQNNNGGNNTRKARSSGDKALYPFWDAPLGGAPVVLRFTPDADPENPFFWRKREVIKLPFNGIVGGDYPTDKRVEVTVQCMNMFENKRCPIIDYTRPWWKDDATPAQKALAKLYWKKKSMIFQGFVVRSPIVEEEVPENPLRKFIVTPQLFKLIEDSLLDPDMAYMPDHYEGGRDFNIKKSKQGEHNNYGTSGWSNAGPRTISQAERDAIDTFGLFDLKESLGAEPDAEKLAVIEAMFHSSLNGDAFDVASFGGYGFRAYANSREADASLDATAAVEAVTARPTQYAVSTPINETVQAVPAAAPVAPAADVQRKKTPQEILAAIQAKLPVNA